MTGMDWAYGVLVEIALAHGKEHLKLRAQQFNKEVLDACVGMACGDIDYGPTRFTYAYEMVRDVCKELTGGN